MDNIYDFSSDELISAVQALGFKAYRAKQLFSGLHSGRELNGISELPEGLIKKVSENYITKPVIIREKQQSADGTVKFLYELFDGNLIEGVLMRYSYGNTLCVSTQAGCAMGCAFCASSIGGKKRDLTPGEILAQVLTVNSLYGGGKKKRFITNVVLMGSGEPLDNFDNTVKFLRLISCKEGINISLRNISLSTCGIAPKIYDFAYLNLPVTLSFSLHSPFEEKRKKIMPIANRYTISDTLKALKYYFQKTGRRIIIEYSLISDFNCTKEDAAELKKILYGLNCHINLIMLNPVKERGLLPCSRETAEDFKKMLENSGLSVTIRRQTGLDIDGACGQLRRKFIAEGK